MCESNSECADDVCARVVCRLCEGLNEVEFGVWLSLVCQKGQGTGWRGVATSY